MYSWCWGDYWGLYTGINVLVNLVKSSLYIPDYGLFAYIYETITGVSYFFRESCKKYAFIQ